MIEWLAKALRRDEASMHSSAFEGDEQSRKETRHRLIELREIQERALRRSYQISEDLEQGFERIEGEIDRT